MFHGFNGHGWSMGLGWFFGIVILVAVVWIIVKAINQNRQTDRHRDKTPLEILKERYARGEIDREEFEEKKKHLGS